MAEQKTKITPSVKVDQLANFVEKVWGHEEWIANNHKYCGKKLFVRKGHRCSMHQHKIKEETFYLASGKVYLEIEFEGKSSTRILTAGDVQHINIGMWHRFTAIEDAELFEFSTFHMDEDSHRREVAGSVDLASIGF